MDDQLTNPLPAALNSLLADSPLQPSEESAGGGPCRRQEILRRWATAVRAARTASGSGLEAEIRSLAVRLGDRLQLDASRDPARDEARRLSDEMGGGSDGWLDVETLNSLLPRHPGPARLGDQRRSRIEHALEVLARHLRGAGEAPPSVVVHDGVWPADLTIEGLETIRADQPLARAIELFDERAASAVELLRAVRVARLELTDGYHADRHDAALARFGWRDADGDERLLLPTIAVLDRADRVRAGGAEAFGALCAADRPIRLLLLERALVQAPEELGAACLDLPAIAAAYRRLLVVQTTPARPEHLDAALLRLAASRLAGVALVAEPSDVGRLSPMLELIAAHEGRATPCLIYDPDAGDDWAGCLVLDDNPQPERLWAVHPAAGQDNQPFTYAHAVSVHPDYADQFELLGPGATDSAELELHAFLDLAPHERRERTPFIWLEDAEQNAVRAAVAPRLIAACAERSRSWRILRELAGLDNAHAQRAVDQARGELEAEHWRGQQSLVEEHQAELARVREAAGRGGFERMVNALIDGEMPATDTVPGITVQPRPAPSGNGGDPALAIAGVTEAPQAAPEMIVDAAIDSMLCTTCNECTNLNPRMFRYNDDKQAYIADASAGSYAELVKAAERCPARCIHPGAPRSGDPTASAALVARAQPFN